MIDYLLSHWLIWLHIFTSRLVKAAGKDPDEEELDKIELECVRKTFLCTIDMDCFS